MNREADYDRSQIFILKFETSDKKFYWKRQKFLEYAI